MHSLIKRSLFVFVLCTNYAYSQKNFVLVAAPGSGKGTFSQYLINNYDYVQICPGDIFRNEIKNKTELGKRIQPIVDRGDYIDEDTVCTLMAQYLEKVIADNKNFILDGFPRSDYSFAFLDSFFKKNNLMNTVRYVHLIADDATCLNRIMQRQICTQCFTVYNTVSAQPKIQNICDVCNIALDVRTADTEAIVLKRLSYFHSNIEPLVKKAQESYDCIEIQTNRSFKQLMTEYASLTE